MGNWDRRGADELAYALHKHLSSSGLNAPGVKELVAIQRVADLVSRQVQSSSTEVASLRRQTCEVCRGCALYQCDVPSGWSDRCALVLENSTNFGQL